LKEELDFQGVLVSDWGGIDQLGPDYTANVEASVNAGIDMIMLPGGYNEFQASMRTLATDGRIAVTRIDDAVRRILRAKFTLGLFEHSYADTTLLPLVGSPEHRAVARQCVRESLVLLKSKNSVLPLPKTNARILVAGSHADNLGYQCGGWTVRWQGGSDNTTIGTTILDGMRKVAPSAAIDFSLAGDFEDTRGTCALVVIGEAPYAEGRGDKKDLALPEKDVKLIRKMKSYGHPVVVVLISGRPLIIDEILDDADAIIAAWLPGTEGEGVADVLFGDFLPRGILSHTWPKSMDQIPINVGDPKYDPLFPYGFGMTSFKEIAR
jgi:beta-glucosidase